jgi:elongation factor P
MITTSEFKAGIVIRLKGELYEILSYQHVKMQQRAPIVRTKLLRLKGGNVREEAFRSGEKFDDVYMERKELQYLYRDGDLYHFMDTSDYQDAAVPAGVIGDNKAFLKENDHVEGLYCDGALMSINLPPNVELKVTGTEPGVRGDTAKAGTKPATVETGAIVRVPLFVGTGETIRINTRTGEYIERVKT